MLSEEQIEVLGETLVPLYQHLEEEVIADVTRRLQKSMSYTRTMELEIIALQKLGYSPAKIRAEVMRRLRADKEFQRMVEQNTIEYKQTIANLLKSINRKAAEAASDVVESAVEMSWADDLSLWESAGKKLDNHSRLNQITEAMKKQTLGELKNITKTTGFHAATGFESIKTLYRRELDKALVKRAYGAFSPEQCVYDVVRELSRSGIRCINYDSGRSYQLDTAARMCLRTAGNQIVAQVMNRNLADTGEALVQVSAHWGARNQGEGIANHEQWQGKVYSVDGKKHPEEEKRINMEIRDLKETTGYDVHTGQGNIEGLHGVNCRHQHYVFFEGISEPAKYPMEPEEKVINGKRYDYYAMTQKQRQMERDIRALRREKEALKALGQDTKPVEARIRQKTKEYQEFSKACGIRAKMNRIRVENDTSDLTKTQAWKAYEAERKKIAIFNKHDRIKTANEEKVVEVHTVGKFDRNIYKCITEDIVTDEVVITDERIQHIRDRHPNDYERFYRYIPEIIENPDYIIKANKPDTAVILKEFIEKDEKFQMVLRIKTASDREDFKNSIITFLNINERTWNKYLRNKEILYRKE